MLDLAPLSTIGSWAVLLYIVGAAFFIAHRTDPEEGDE